MFGAQIPLQDKKKSTSQIPACSAAEAPYLHDSYVVREGSDSQAFDHDVRQVVGIEHQVVPAVLQKLLVVPALILPDVADCSIKKTHPQIEVRSSHRQMLGKKGLQSIDS